METETKSKSITAYESDCISRAAAHVGMAVALLRMAATPEALINAAELQPWVARVEKLA